ncbi:MAG: acyl--CoA ligase [Alphaproteobacteria bacterium]|nr:acyl--CoA ligase [Alphaproteobacteria bacterium]
MSNASSLLLDGLDDARVAVVKGREATRAVDLRRRALGLARWLTEQGLESGDRVLMLVPPGAEFAAALMATVRVGAVPVLLETSQAPGAWIARVQASRPRFALTTPALRLAFGVPGLHGLVRRLGRPMPPPVPELPFLVLPREAPGEGPLISRDPDDEALILFTSGTTSAPREVAHTHGSLPGFLAHVRAVAEGLPAESYLAETPQQIFYALLMRSTCYLVTGQGEQRVQRTLKLLQERPIQAWFGSPWTWQRWLARDLPLPQGLRSVLLGSAPVSRPFLRRLLARLGEDVTLRCVYGLTELGPACLIDGREKAALEGEGDPMGAPVAGVELRIWEGEVQLRAASAAPASLRPDGWLETGDLGALVDGQLWLRGRAKDMILRRGINLYPGVLEPLLAEQVEACALVGVWDAEREDERVVLAWEGAPDFHPGASLGDATPDHLLHLESLPRKGRQHKVDKEALRALARARFGIPG